MIFLFILRFCIYVQSINIQYNTIQYLTATANPRCQTMYHGLCLLSIEDTQSDFLVNRDANPYCKGMNIFCKPLDTLYREILKLYGKA